MARSGEGKAEMRADPHGCNDDVLQEELAELERQAHEAGECRKGCPYCEDDRERGKESLGG